MKKMKKTGIILIIFIVINLFFTNVVKADSLDSATTQANNFINAGQSAAEGILGKAKIVESLIPIAQALRTIGIGIVLCVGVIMGIKWVTAKPDEQAKIKQQSVGLLVSAIVIIGATTIWSIALKIVSQL